MKVLKKDGTVQTCNLAKIKLSIACASDEARQPLTLSDLEILARDISKKMKSMGKDIIKTDEIHSIVYGTLIKGGFNTIAEHYKNYAKRLDRENAG